MRNQRTMRFAYQTAACDLCHDPIDFTSGFFFEVGDGSIVHPDCFSYFMAHDVRPTMGVTHTCGDALCVNPSHLTPRGLGA